MSLLHIHGTADENLPIDGGAGKGVAGVSFRPPIDGIRTLARLDGCPATPDRCRAAGGLSRRIDPPDQPAERDGPWGRKGLVAYDLGCG